MRSELGEFLRARRARIKPEDAGFPRGGRRRVPGLRRDELARLAGVSVEYYTRLEQGRSPNVSDSVLDAIADALSLTDTEREHLRMLVRPTRHARPLPRGAQIRPSLQNILDQMDRIPAVVLGPRLDVLAWSRLGAALGGYEDATEWNLPRQLFLDPKSREIYPEWEDVAADTVAVLRRATGRAPDDPELTALIGSLSIRSAEFRALWARHDIREKTFGRKRINHPLVGELDLAYESFPLTGEHDMMLVTYIAEPGSPSAEKLAVLASWSAPEHEREITPRRADRGAADRAEE